MLPGPPRQPLGTDVPRRSLTASAERTRHEQSGDSGCQAGAVEVIRKQGGDLGTALATWHARDDSGPCPDARRAANAAVGAVDAALAALHTLRQSLVSEIKASDDATAARVDALLRRREGNPHER